MPLSLLIAAVLTSPPAPPPVVVDRATERPLIAWIADAPRCDGGPVAATMLRRPLAGLGYATMPPQQQPLLTLRFRIGADGRPLSIEQVPESPGGSAYRFSSEDVIPSLAVSRFAAGAPRTGCEITYRLRVTPLAESPIEDLVSYTLSPESGRLPKQGWDRIRQPGTDCFGRAYPQVLVREIPEYAKIPATPGVRDWVLTGYDLPGDGRVRNVHRMYGTGNAALDAAAVKAMRKWRYAAGERTGCANPFSRMAGTLPAPVHPDPDTLRPAAATCPGDGNWERPPTLVYPAAFRRRAIEGWAIVAYDLAPWGELGNIRALASEPARAFGTEAEQMIRNARAAKSATGATGCIRLVRFVMEPRVAGMEDGQNTPSLSD